MISFRSYSLTKLDLLSLVTSLLFLEGWYYTTFSQFFFGHLIFCSIFLYIAFLAGRIILENWGESGITPDFNSCLLAGFFLLNTLLYLSAQLLPVSLQVSAAAITATVLVAALLAPSPAGGQSSGWATYLSLLLLLTAATLWGRNSLSPVVDGGNNLIFTPWADSFYHATQIRMLASAEGAGSVSTYTMSGVPAPFYHAASYMIPAALTKILSVPAYGTYTSFWMPFGLFISGLGAFTFGKSLWGAWPGLAAAASLLLLPDTSQHGMSNTYFSYHWMQIIAPGGAYGVALLALGWLVMLQACRTGRIFLVALSYLLAGCSIVYKAHFFVANALLLLIVPPLFLKGLSRRLRVAWVTISVMLFVAATATTQASKSLPTVKLNWSATKHFLRTTYEDIHQGALLKTVFAGCFTPASSLFSDIAWGLPLLFLCSIGLWGVICLLVIWKVRKDVPPPVLLLPLMAILNFLLMAEGLAYNEGRGNADELLHRPFAWLYFLVVTWTAAAAYHWWFKDRPPVKRAGKAAMAVIIVGMMAVPGYFGKQIEKGPAMGFAMNNIPLEKGLVLSCQYLASATGRKDVIQDSVFDPILAVTALSERQAFVIRQQLNYRPDPDIDKRVALVQQWKSMTKEADIRALAMQNGIRWLLVHPGDRLFWPSTVQDNPAFSAYGYRVYRLF